MLAVKLRQRLDHVYATVYNSSTLLRDLNLL